MRFCILSFLFVIIFWVPSSAQSLFQRSQKSVYALYGRHLPTMYNVDSGNARFVSRKMTFSLEAGFNADVPLKKKLRLRTGLQIHLHFIFEPGYGVTGTIPPQIILTPRPNWVQDYIKGVEYVERISVSVPAKLQYLLKSGKRWDFAIAAGPVISFYLPTTYEDVGKTYIIESTDPSKDIRGFQINRTFKRKSYVPHLEGQVDLEAARKFKRRGALVGGLKFHVGTRSLEQSEFTIWPGLPQYRSRGHFTLNRSYIGVYAGYRFGKHNNLKTKTNDRF